MAIWFHDLRKVGKKQEYNDMKWDRVSIEFDGHRFSATNVIVSFDGYYIILQNSFWRLEVSVNKVKKCILKRYGKEKEEYVVYIDGGV